MTEFRILINLWEFQTPEGEDARLVLKQGRAGGSSIQMVALQLKEEGVIEQCPECGQVTTREPPTFTDVGSVEIHENASIPRGFR